MSAQRTVVDTIGYYNSLQSYHEHMAQHSAWRAENATSNAVAKLYKQDERYHEECARQAANSVRDLAHSPIEH